MVQVYGSQEPLDHGHIGLFHLGTLVFHHIVEFGIAADFNHVQFSIGIFDHDLEELLHGEIFIGLIVNVIQVDFEFELDAHLVDRSVFVFSLDEKGFLVHFVGIHIVPRDPELADIIFDVFLGSFD